MTTILNITGDINETLTLPVPEKVKVALAHYNEALKVQGAAAKEQPVNIPDQVVLELVESSMADLRKFGSRERVLKAQDKPEDYMLELMQLRAQEGTDLRVLKEMVQAMTPTATAKITHACLYGELPKAQAPAKPST